MGDVIGSGFQEDPKGNMRVDDFCRSALQQGLEYHIADKRGLIPAGLVQEMRALAMPPIPWDVALGRWFDIHFQPLEAKRTYARPSRRQGSTPDIPRPRYVLGEFPEYSRTFGVVLDTSGSMYGNDRLELVKTGLCAMVDAMRPDDRVAIITYSGSVKKLVESTLISKGAESIKRAIRSLNANGGTAGGPAMQMAYDEAKAHYSESANNRIIMCTDGDFNVGVSSTEALVEMVESYQKSGIYLSIMGFGTGNFDDSRMESLSNHGNGTYNYIDSEEEMIKVFVNERSHFYSVANDTKCQVRFNPEAVAQYRLLGYENRLMSQEEFEDSSKDAGEIGAGQTITALYEVIPTDAYTKDASLATFETRYKFSLKDTESRSLTADVKTAESASENMNFAAGVAAYALVLRESEYKGSATLSLARELVNGARTFDPDGFRAQLVQLMDKLKD